MLGRTPERQRAYSGRRLEDHGLLVREAHADDRRRAVLTLSPKGRRLNLTAIADGIETALG